MTAQEAQKRCCELALEQARLRCEQASRHYQRSVQINQKSYGAISREQIEDEHLAYEIARLKVEECEIRLAALDLT